jgi:DNA-binding NarL/FixJ family response regulator
LVSKAHGVDQLLRDAIRRVLAGGRFLSPDMELKCRMFRTLPEAFPKRLTAKQQSLMPYFAHGDSDDKIAQALSLGVHAVRSEWHLVRHRAV